MTPRHLFVYGTLRLGSNNPHAAFLHACCVFTGPGRMRGSLYRVSSYPGAVHDAKSSRVVEGDIFEIPDNAEAIGLLSQLDHYEGVDDLNGKPEYRREVISILTESRRELPCWVYIYNHDLSGKPEIKSGNFLAPPPRNGGGS